jgi:ABC-2 type transport system permease protein
MRALTAQWRTELLLSLRQGEQLLVSVGIPVLALVFFSLVDVLPGRTGQTHAVETLAPAVLALAVMSTAMVSLGIATGFERYYGVLKRLGATPLGRGRLVGAKAAMVLTVEGLQLLILVPVSLLLGWRPGGTPILLIPAYLLGTAAFAGIGLLLAGTLRGTLNLAVCNALYVVLLLFGGIVIPAAKLPGPMAALAHLLPSSALADVLHAALTPGEPFPGTAWLVLTAWAVVMPVLAARLFRWE